MLALYSLTLCLSAVLMFSIQPVMSKIVLPVLGGSPMVWNACVMFFQLLLLLGYGYVHVAQRLMGRFRHAGLHVILLAASVVFLPVAVAPEMLQMAAHDHPVAWLLAALGGAVGIPFFLLAGNAPLVQSWLADSTHPAAANPYRLYAASNLGSMIGLLAYPFTIEPHLALSLQRMVWSAGYAVLILLLLGCAWMYFKYRRPEPESATERKRLAEEAGDAPVTLARRAMWVGLAFVPSAMMLAVTGHITTDIAPIPLLWVVPLALYLLSFVFTFANRPLGVAFSNRLMLPFLLPVVVTIGLGANNLPTWPWAILLIVHLVYVLMRRTPDIHHPHIFARVMDSPIGFFAPLVLFTAIDQDYLMLSLWHVLGFFFVAMVCHGRLVQHKPAPQYLTEFYFLLSLGGALGGMFVTLVAPLIFNGIYEMPICLVLAAAALIRKQAAPEMKTPLTVALALFAGALVWAFYMAQYQHLGAFETAVIDPFTLWMRDQNAMWKAIGFTTKSQIVLFLALLVVMCAAYAARRRGLALTVLVALVVPVMILQPGKEKDIRYEGRNFFGVLQVDFKAKSQTMHLTNGTTEHGFQTKAYGRNTVPNSYYRTDGPLGVVIQAMRARPQKLHQPIAVVGLGSGAVACYAEPGQAVDFYEINPVVKELATTPEYFSYLRDCRGDNRVIMGDARLSLKDASDGRYGLIVLDAFNSDAIPIHLMTLEALDLYLKKLAPGGVIAYHTSNRNLDLRPVVGNLAAARGLYGVWAGFNGSQWVMVARASKDIGPLTQDGRYAYLVPNDRLRTWTDDFSDIVSVISTRWF